MMDLDSIMELNSIALKDYGGGDTLHVEDRITHILPPEGAPRHFENASVMLEIERQLSKSLIRLDGVNAVHAKHMPVTRTKEEEEEFRRENKSDYKKHSVDLDALREVQDRLTKKVQKLETENQALREVASSISSVEVWTYDKHGGVTNHWVLDSSSGTVPVGNAVVKVNSND
jgi:hypothetical protein